MVSSYLTGHYQQVRLASGQDQPIPLHHNQGFDLQAPNSSTKKLSGPLQNPMGVYQGTCLGPLLYNIFSNDLGLYIESGAHIIQYADDTQILISGKKDNLADMITKMESILQNLHHCTIGPIQEPARQNSFWSFSPIVPKYGSFER